LSPSRLPVPPRRLERNNYTRKADGVKTVTAAKDQFEFLHYREQCAQRTGHQNGGILIGKVYGHLDDAHKVATAQRLTFLERTPSAW
jgi:hypothetical protein